MAARSIKNFAGDIGEQSFYNGLYLVLIAIATGFLKLFGLCVRKRCFNGLVGPPSSGSVFGWRVCVHVAVLRVSPFEAV
jgi:hypothetical protein